MSSRDAERGRFPAGWADPAAIGVGAPRRRRDGSQADVGVDESHKGEELGPAVAGTGRRSAIAAKMVSARSGTRNPSRTKRGASVPTTSWPATIGLRRSVWPASRCRSSNAISGSIDSSDDRAAEISSKTCSVSDTQNLPTCRRPCTPHRLPVTQCPAYESGCDSRARCRDPGCRPPRSSVEKRCGPASLRGHRTSC